MPNYKLILVLLTIIGFYSCAKQAGPVATISVNVINASASNLPEVSTPNATGYYSQLQKVGSGSFFVYTIPVGGKVTIAGSDTGKPTYSDQFSGKAGSIYSLFLTGDSGNNVILHQDTIPYRTDSTIGIRYMNLSPGAAPISVNIAGNPNGSELSGLAYGSLTEFKAYDCTSNPFNNGYVFEFRDTSGNLLASYNTANTFYQLPIFQNFTLILFGDPGNQQVMEVNNF